jgi:hypothetical protein
MKYFSLLFFIITAIAFAQSPGYGYLRGKVTLPNDFPVNSLPVRINQDIVFTDDNGYFISLCKSGDLEIEFQDTILRKNLPENEILYTDINAEPAGVLIKSYSTNKMPDSATLNNEEITDIRYVNNSIWLPQCFKKYGLLTLNHTNEFDVPFNSSATYSIPFPYAFKYDILIEFERKSKLSAKILINNISTEGNLSLRYQMDDLNWYTAILKSKDYKNNLPLIKFNVIEFNPKINVISERVTADLSAGRFIVNIKKSTLSSINKQHFTYQDLNGTFQSKITTPTVNRMITDDGFAFCDNKKVKAPIEENTTFLMSDLDLPDQYTRYKWLVFEDNKWRTVESEWISNNDTHPSASIHKLKSSTKADFMAYTTSTYIPKVWHSENVTIPYPDYAPSINMPIKFQYLPTIKGRVTRSYGNLPSTSRLLISPIEINQILKNITPEIERDLRLYNVNFDINTGDFNIILPGYGKYLLKFYTTDRSFPENQMIIEKNMENVSINFQLKH